MDTGLLLLAGGALLLVVMLSWGAVRVWRMARELRDHEMGLLDHLRELRYRVLAALASVTVVTVLLFSFDLQPQVIAGYSLWVPVPSVVESLATRFLRGLLTYALPADVRLVVLTPSEAIVAQLQAALLGGILVASPLVAYHVAAFVAPALHPDEMRIVALLAPMALLLFLGGVAFGIFVMVPVTLTTLYAYAGPFGAEALARPQDILTFVLLVSSLFGVAFELPLVMAGLAYAGVMSPETMGRHWRGVVVGSLVLGAVLSDPSPVTQLLIGGPLLVLYFIGLGTARLAWRAGRRNRTGLSSTVPSRP